MGDVDSLPIYDCWSFAAGKVQCQNCGERYRLFRWFVHSCGRGYVGFFSCFAILGKGDASLLRFNPSNYDSLIFSDDE